MRLAAAIGLESEDRFEVRVMRAARTFGWCGRHERNSEGCRGIHTFVRDGHRCGWGWPDWVFVKDGHPPKFRELKTETGRLTRDQKYWQMKLAAAGADVGVWRPSMWDQIVKEFAGEDEARMGPRVRRARVAGAAPVLDRQR